MSTDPSTHRPVVTLAALAGAAGTVIGPRVAKELGVPFLDRAISEAVARRTGLPEAVVAEVDEAPRGVLDRVAARLGRASTLSGGVGGSIEQLDVGERAVRRRIEEFLAEAAVAGGVALGRGGMVVLRTVPWALHVYLGGPREARVAQWMTIDGIDRATAEARQKAEDRTRISYVRRAYGVDGRDPALYHLMLDSTALDVDTCVNLVVTAALARIRNPVPSPRI